VKLPDWARAARSGWKWTGDRRPPWASPTRPGEESVWDYPRPPLLASDSRHITVSLHGTLIADTQRAVRVLETASPPTVYIPPDDVAPEFLERAPGASRCEWKGTAEYWSVRLADGSLEAACGWSYPECFEDYVSLSGFISFYPARLECRIDGERVQPQGGGFYGGWVTREVIGPFKGDPGAGAW